MVTCGKCTNDYLEHFVVNHFEKLFHLDQPTTPQNVIELRFELGHDPLPSDFSLQNFTRNITSMERLKSIGIIRKIY